MSALLPLNNPVHVAEEYALVDPLSDGRRIAKLLRGAPYEYLVYNVPPAESCSRFEEVWDLVVCAWTDTEPFGWEREYYHFRHVSIWRRLIQQPALPIFISGSSREWPNSPRAAAFGSASPAPCHVRLRALSLLRR